MMLLTMGILGLLGACAAQGPVDESVAGPGPLLKHNIPEDPSTEPLPPTDPMEPLPAPKRVLLVPRNDLPGLPNFAQVSDGLYRGAQPTAEGMRMLKAMGIKTVINLRWLNSDRKELEGTGLHYLHIRAKAWHPEDEDIATVLKVIADPANRPVFVHCQHGADRTGCSVAAYRMVVEGWTPEDAALELRNFGFHPVFKQITRYLRHFDGVAMKELVNSTEESTLTVIK